MAIKLLLFAGLFLVSNSLDTSTLCRELLKLDCTAYNKIENDESICGTNNVHYDNFCLFSQARCRDLSIDIKQVGNCLQSATRPTPATTMLPTPPPTTAPSTTVTTTLTGPITAATTPDPSVELLCKNKQYIVCPTTVDIVCGSDNNLYKNSCLFATAHCDDRSLVQVDISKCRH